MGTELAKTEEKRMIATARSAGDILAQKAIITEVMKKVMKDGIHYGKIPGCGDKPALLKPGIEALTSTFRIALNHTTEDLSNEDSVRYRVTSTATYSPTGQVLGDGLGECSSDERKYKWRAPVCEEEFNEAPENRKREFWKKGWNKGAPTKEKQVRTDHADIANTVLKMATKRADAAAIILALGVSDIFAQDIEEWTPEMVAAMAGDEPKIQQPQSKTKAAAPATKPAPPKPAPPKPAPAPAPEPAPPKQSRVDEPDPPMDDDLPGNEPDEPEDGLLVGYVVACTVEKTGTSKRGPWTLHKIKINEDDFMTFDTKLFAAAQKFLADNQRVTFTYEGNHRGGYNLASIQADDVEGVPF